MASSNTQIFDNEGLKCIEFDNKDQGIRVSFDPYTKMLYINGYTDKKVTRQGNMYQLVHGGEISLDEFLSILTGEKDK